MKFSLIIPVYNAAPYLRECLDSCLAQDISAADYEIIAVNDGSTDGSPAILREYEAAHPNRFVIINQPNAGPGPARNAGFAASRGDYIWFIDSDDAIRRDSLATLQNILFATGAEVLNVEHAFFADFLPALGELVNSTAVSVSPAEALCFFRGAPWDKIFARKLLLRANISYPALCVAEDTAETFRLIAQAQKIVKIESVCYFYRQRQGSIMHTFSERKMQDWIAAFDALKNQIPLFPALREEYEYCLWRGLRWAISHIEKSARRCNAEGRSAIAAHLPQLKTMLAAAANPANPYIGITDGLTKFYETSLSWRLTAPLRCLFSAPIRE